MSLPDYRFTVLDDQSFYLLQKSELYDFKDMFITNWALKTPNTGHEEIHKGNVLFLVVNTQHTFFHMGVVTL